MKGVPVVVIDGVGQQAVGESGHGGGGFSGVPQIDDSSLCAESFAIIECDAARARWNANKRDAERVEDMHLGIGQSFSEMVEKSVSATKRARVSVTGGGVAILFSCEMGI